ncbi:hypothetical protein GUJ93_ZPchr0006g41981 [Zizania palustris]|uniref:Uncharacterized protein n=1 Tax=Zizania palustris TaxID=103762 RepID=A0A8J5SVV1_ZIZPA|nr:hypothetical protein GUJ93_ZPchr0006g41981 [Zizania palustris]
MFVVGESSSAQTLEAFAHSDHRLGPEDQVGVHGGKLDGELVGEVGLHGPVRPVGLASGDIGDVDGGPIKVIGIQAVARDEEEVFKLAVLAGKPLEVDSASLRGSGTVRLKVACKDPAKIGGTSELYFDREGYNITWILEEEFADVFSHKPDNLGVRFGDEKSDTNVKQFQGKMGDGNGNDLEGSSQSCKENEKSE